MDTIKKLVRIRGKINLLVASNPSDKDWHKIYRLIDKVYLLVDTALKERKLK